VLFLVQAWQASRPWNDPIANWFFRPFARRGGTPFLL
jgi:hypothetical protein